MPTMRLLVVSTWCPTPAVNGSRQRAFHLLRALCGQHVVQLITFAGPGDDETLGSLAHALERIEIVRASPFPQGPPGFLGLLSPTPRSLVQAFSRDAAAMVAARLPDCDGAVALGIPAASYLTGAAVPVLIDELHIGHLHEAVHAAHGLTRLRRTLTWWKSRRFARRLAEGASVVTVASDPDRSHLGRAGCDLGRVLVVPNGADPADLQMAAAPVPNTLVYPGSLLYQANLDAMQYFIADVLPRIQRTRPGVTLHISGDCSAEAAAALPPGPGVVLTGRVDDVRRLIADSAVCVVPVRLGEGTRVKILESMALGTPVVSTTKGAEGLAVVHEKDLLIADTPDAFASQVIRLLEDEALRDRLSANGRDTVRRLYTWDRSAAVWLGAIGRLAQHRRPA